MEKRQPNPKLMLDPTATPLERCLDELVFVMKTHGMVLGALPERPGVMILGKITEGTTRAIPIAEIHQINMTHSEWRPVEQIPNVVTLLKKALN